MKIRAIIFDCFGVLVSETLIGFGRKYLSDRTDDLQKLHDSNRAVDLGYISVNEFHKTVSQLTGLSRDRVFKELEMGSSRDEMMMRLVERLKSRYKIGILSNISPGRLDDFFTTKDKTLFDYLGLSYDMGFVKPDERAYKTVLDNLGVLAEEAVFIDDQPRNVDVANRIGLKGLLFVNQDSLERELREYGILTS